MTDDFDDEAPKVGRDRTVDQRAVPWRVGVVVPDVRALPSSHAIEARLAEFEGLAQAIGVTVVFAEIVRVREVKPATFIGGGHVEELKQRVQAEKLDVLLVDAALHPIQQRNLEKETGAKVLDRTGLILEIFGDRAATREGVLQVELAHLNYQKSRLVRSWTHLERQRGSGGMGFMGGPGETQLESDRRQLQDRIKMLEERLEKVRLTRSQQKGRRDAIAFPVVALVGYTNAGKSSLFNALTGAGVFAKDLLFATLDTTVRKLALPHGREVMLSDTVGFVSELPHDLVAAFRATLEEVTDANVMLHVRDIANPDSAAQAADVLKVLDELGVDPDRTPIVEVWNKVDLLPAADENGVPPLSTMHPMGKVAATVPVSAFTGQGLDALLDTIEKVLGAQARTYRVTVPHTAGADLGWLYGHAEIMSRGEPDDFGQLYEVRIESRYRSEFSQRFAGRIEGGEAA
ncbi:MAG: GTPase HflX [Devosia sp.]